MPHERQHTQQVWRPRTFPVGQRPSQHIVERGELGNITEYFL
jgi:hypothetical protein